jgi:RNA polymerase sigma-70 factor (ECF subfamily)
MAEADAVSSSETTSVTARTYFDEFYRKRRTEMVRALALALGNRDLGLEAADEAFTRALERWSDIDGYENPEGWVYRVGLNWARSKLRRRAFVVGALFEEPVHVDDLPDPDLLNAVEGLSLRYRSVVVARFFLDWSVEQTADSLGIPEGTVKTRQARALERLRRQLGDRNES